MQAPLILDCCPQSNESSSRQIEALVNGPPEHSQAAEFKHKRGRGWPVGMEESMDDLFEHLHPLLLSLHYLLKRCV